MATQPELQPPDPGDALRIEVGRLRYAHDQLSIAFFGGPGIIGMREEHGRAVARLEHNDVLLAERINSLIYPKVLAAALTGLAIIFGACGIEVFVIKLQEMHKLGLW